MMGSWGTGKSKVWCDVAKWLPDDQRIFLLDTDNAFDRLAEGEPWENKVQVRDLAKWNDYIEGIDWAFKEATRDDWLAVDMMDQAWEAVQEFYVEERWGSDAASYFLQWQTGGNSGSPLAGDYGTNWGVINKLYKRFSTKILRFPGHVILTSPADQIAKDKTGSPLNESKEVVDTYGRFGVKPRGQKHLGHLAHTVLLTQRKSNNAWTYTTIKDRNRAELKGEEVVDFVMSYLVKIGGWKL